MDVLSDALNPQAEWIGHREPFRHILARPLFAPSVYRTMVEAFGRLREDRTQLWTSTENYDAQILAFHRDLRPCFAPLFDPVFLDSVAVLTGIEIVPLLDAALHHIPRGSRSGWLHTDLCSAWFGNSDGAQWSDPVFADRRLCDYFRGTRRQAEGEPKEFIRAASLLFYLDNDGWKQGDGGETEIYASSRPGVGPRKLVPPEGNSLLIFENTPHSYHRMVENPGKARNSVVLWLHTTLKFGLARWGKGIARSGVA